MAKKTSTTKDWTRGGQIIDHNIRMIKQIAKKVLIASLLFSLVYIFIYTLNNTSSHTRKLAINNYYSSLMVLIGATNGTNHFFKNPIKHGIIANSNITLKAKKEFEVVLMTASIHAILLSILFYFLISLYIRKRGAKEQGDKFMRGGSLVGNKDMKKHLDKKDVNQDLSLGVVPTLKNSETIHFEISGSPGTGKSQTLKHLIQDIKNRGDRAIIYSTSNEFIESFYDEEKDVILNPLDDRSPSWNPWNEITEIYHYDDIASSLIPESEGAQNDPFWTNAARTLLSNTMQKFAENNNHSIKDLLQKLLNIKHKDIAKMLKNTESAALVAEGGEKTALSITATLSTYVKSLKFLRSNNDDFSIRKWVTNEDANNNGCVFLTSRNDQHDTLKSLISCWVDIFATSVMSLPESRERRIWLIIDELPSLHRLKSLENLMAQSRKYGGCCVIGFQSYSQMEKIYGSYGAKSLTSLSASKVMFRNNDVDNATWVSKELGREEIKTTNENITVSAREARDAVSISENEKLKELVLPTQIINLENLHGFYRLPGDYPVVSFVQKLFTGGYNNQGFISSAHTDHIYLENSKTDQVNKLVKDFFGKEDFSEDEIYVEDRKTDTTTTNTDDDNQNPKTQSEKDLLRGFN